jgi:spermidine synthase
MNCMNPRIYRLGLLLSVTLTGMAVLIVEITATRMLTPYFGNSVFTLSSVISTILFALAAGYYLGGRIADRRPSERLFFGLIALAGFCVLLLQLLNAELLPRIAYRLSLLEGPLLVSLLLFLLPALFLGMLSPFAIRLLHGSEATGVGTASGLVFFWSTLGSIVGSLAAGFWLIPGFGVSGIVIAVGLGLVLLGAVGLLVFGSGRRAAGGLLVAVGLAAAIGVAGFESPRDQSLVYSKDGLYEKIVIRDIPYRGRKARILMQDRNINSGMFLDDGRMAFDYTRYFDLYRLFVRRLEHALVIGGGAYSVPKAILRDTPAARIDVAEIEPALFSLAQRYFGLPEVSRLRNHVVDGRRFLQDSDTRYDLVFLDVYHSFASVPMQFATREFFRLVNDRLADDGVLIANFYGSLAADTRPLVLSLLKTMRGEFAHVYLLATADPASEELQNFIFVARRSTAAGDALELGDARRVDFSYPELRRVPELELRPGEQELSAALVFTDDYAPVELYAARVLRRYDALLAKKR